MGEPNPYESPHTGQPLAPVQVVKRGIGAATILLLTPVAVLITGGISCGASILYTDSVSAPASPPILRLNDVGLAIFLVPPAAVLIGMIVWAIRAYRRSSPVTKAESSEN